MPCHKVCTTVQSVYRCLSTNHDIVDQTSNTPFPRSPEHLPKPCYSGCKSGRFYYSAQNQTAPAHSPDTYTSVILSVHCSCTALDTFLTTVTLLCTTPSLGCVHGSTLTPTSQSSKLTCTHATLTDTTDPICSFGCTSKMPSLSLTCNSSNSSITFQNAQLQSSKLWTSCCLHTQKSMMCGKPVAI